MRLVTAVSHMHMRVARVALPVRLWEPDGWRQGLQRLSVDPAAGTLSLKPLVERSHRGLGRVALKYVGQGYLLRHEGKKK